MPKHRSVREIALDLERCEADIKKLERRLKELRERGKALMEEMSAAGESILGPIRSRPLTADLAVAVGHKLRYALRQGMSRTEARRFALQGMTELAAARNETVPPEAIENLDKQLSEKYGISLGTTEKKAK